MALSVPDRIDDQQRVLVWGAGAIGGVVGAHAARDGHAVTFVDNDPAHVAAIRADGLKVTGPLVNFTIDAPAYLPQELTGRWDMVLLCVKAHHTEAAVDELAPFLGPTGYVVSLQNGLNERAIFHRVGVERTVGAFVNFGADVLEPGVVQFAGRGAVVIGELDGRASDRVVDVLSVVRCAEPNAIATDNIWGYLWGKMGYGAMLFATALTDESIADVLADPAAQDALTALALEVSAVATAEGVAQLGFNGFDPAAFSPTGSSEARARSYEAMVTFNRKSAKARSGVWRDLAVRNRKTEVDGQFQPILMLAAQHRVATPLLARLVDLVHDVEDGRRQRSPDTLQAVLLGGDGGAVGAWRSVAVASQDRRSEEKDVPSR